VREVIRSEILLSYSITMLQDMYDEVLHQLDFARAVNDHAEVARLLVDKELVGAAMDVKFDALLGNA
jgi:hypothetical protein